MACAVALTACSPDEAGEAYGYRREGAAPWCSLTEDPASLRCDYLSEKHCQQVALTRGEEGPIGAPLCVPNPE